MKRLATIFPNENNFQKALFISSLLIFLCATVEGFARGLFSFSLRWRLIGYAWVLLTLIALVLVIISYQKHWNLPKAKPSSILSTIQLPPIITILLFILFVSLFSFLVFWQLNKHFDGFFFRFSVFWIFALLGESLLKLSFRAESPYILFLFAALAIATGYQISMNLMDISANPFSLGWSEGSRYYYASLPFSQKLYGMQFPWSFLHPSRYLLLAAPFLFNSSSILLHRVWQVFLWVAMIAMLSASLVFRLKIKNFFIKAIFFLSAFLLFFQAPIYYHLCLAAFLVLFGFHSEQPRLNIVIIAIASLWAGISRINWFPLPALLATLLYVLESPFSGKVKGYFKFPILYSIVGLAASLLAQLAYIPLSGNTNIKNFGTSFFSDLLWYRLLPNPNFPLGIIPGIALLTFPYLWLSLLSLKEKSTQLASMRRFIIFSILLVFFVGGLFVSVKIGGGSNLHNLDAFILLLFVVAAYVFFEKIADDPLTKKPNIQHLSKKTLYAVFSILFFLTPLIWSLASFTKKPSYDWERIQEELAAIDQTAARVAAQGGEVLFISQRQLFSFHQLHNVPLTPQYELLTLMEMAISNFEEYLTQFEQDLRDQRFDLIVAYKQYIVFKDKTQEFPEENNAWVKNVSIPLLRYYQPITWLRYTDMEIYIPKR